MPGDIADLGTRDILGMYYRMLEQVTLPDWIMNLAMRTNSDQAMEKYEFLGQVPILKEWLGERNVAQLREDGFEVINRHFESSIEFNKSDMRRDKTGQIIARISEHVERSNSHWIKLLVDLLVQGQATNGYDGVPFFGTTHPNDGTESGTQANYIEVDISAFPVEVQGSPTQPSPEQAYQAMMAGVRQIAGIVDDQGEPMNETAMEFQVLTPLALDPQFMSGYSNPRGTGLAEQHDAMRMIDIACSVRLDSAGWTDQFVIGRSDSSIKPIILQEETEIMVSALAEGSDFAHTTDKHQYGLDGWRNAAFGQWQNICLVKMV